MRRRAFTSSTSTINKQWSNTVFFWIWKNRFFFAALAVRKRGAAASSYDILFKSETTNVSRHSIPFAKIKLKMLKTILI